MKNVNIEFDYSRNKKARAGYCSSSVYQWGFLQYI